MDGEGDALGAARRRVTVAVAALARRSRARQGTAGPLSDAGRPWRSRVSHGPSSRRRRAWPVRTSRTSPSPTAYALLALSRLEVLAEHVLSRLDPGDTAGSWHVEQDAPTDQTALEDVDRPGVGAVRGHRRLRDAVEQRPLETRRGRTRRYGCARRCGSRDRRSPWRSARTRTRCPRRSASSCGGRPARGHRCAPRSSARG